jgi:tetratricopeptide (TPR) repeat protein
MENHSIKIEDVNGDLIGAGVSGIGNFVGREISYTVKNNVFNINNPSTDSLAELRKILLLPNEISADRDSDTSDTRTMQDLRTLEKRTQEFLNLIKAADAKLKTQTTEVSADELHFSRTDLLLKRTIVLVEQADRYWNVVAKPSDVNMYKAKLKEACSLLHEANEIDPYNTEVLLYLAKIQCKLMPDNQTNMQKILYRIQNLLTSPNNDKEWFHLAEATFLLAITSEPLDNELLLDARTMFEKLGQRGWIRKCNELLQPDNNSTIYAKLWYTKGTALANLGKYDQAIECFDKAIKINPNEPKIWYTKGTALANLGKYDQAIECFDKGSIEPNNQNIHIDKGTALHYLGKYEQSIECFDKAIKINPNESDAWFGKGISLHYLGKYEQSIECFDKAIKINPNESDLWYSKGTALYCLGKYEESIKCYNKSIAIDPDIAIGWLCKGGALNKLGEYEESIKCYNKSIAIDPDNAIGWLCKGKVLKSLGQSEDAKECFNRAKELGLTV